MWGNREQIKGHEFNESYVMLNVAGRTNQVPAYSWTEGGYAIFNAQDHYHKAHGVSGWSVIDLATRTVIRTYMATAEEAVDALLKASERHKDGLMDDAIEELALAVAPLPKRWAECVSDLSRCLRL